MSEDALARALGSKIAIREKLDKIYEKIENLEDKAREIVNPIFEDAGFIPWSMAVGVHECDESPFMLCAYDVIEDPARDHCVFCGQPHERK